MFDAITNGLGPHPPGPEPPAASAIAPQPVRIVEHADTRGSSNDAATFSNGYSPSRAVLELLKRSAESFQSILETTHDVSAAVSMTGTASAASAAMGSVVDEYA